MEEIISVFDLLTKKQLSIPDYQRPYKWQSKNVIELLEDISNALDESDKYKDFKYRIGTIILNKHQTENTYDYSFSEKPEDIFDIVDGQQRIISFSLILYYLDSSFSCSILDSNCSDKETKNHLYENFQYIKTWFSIKDKEYKDKFINAFKNILEVVVLTISNISTAFQLFDSQNTRGKPLDPHDLLKAYHLREMSNDRYEMFHSVNKWESFNPSDINRLFDVYLFPILNWARKEKCPKFTVKNIDEYKGVSESSDYTYAKRARKAEPYFQITEPFVAGKDFFEMVAHYLTLLDDIDKELKNNETINAFLTLNKSVGYNYCIDLFKCAFLCYYDKFHNFDELALKKLLTWAFMLRVDMRNLGFDSVNKYASGDFGFDKYTNHSPMFSIISKARKHTEISNLLISTKRKDNKAEDDKWNDLYNNLKKLNGEDM